MESKELQKQIVQKALERVMETHQVPAHQLLAALKKIESLIVAHDTAVSEMKRISESHDEILNRANAAIDDHEMQSIEYQSLVADLADEVQRISKITHFKGDPGIAPTLDEVVQAIKPHLPKAKEIDKQEIIAALIPYLPKQEESKNIPDEVEALDREALFEEFVTRIQKERLIDVSHIKNAESFLYKTRSGKNIEYKIEELMRGAGAATGGSFTIQIPNGTVNGVNRTFVFTAAPNVIVLDNGNFMNQVSSDGTVNWTIVGTTVTLNQAPLFNIYGF